MQDIKEGRFLFGKRLRGTKRRKLQKDYTLPEMTFYCPLLKLRSTRPVCQMLKRRKKEAEAEPWDLFTQPPECETCDGRPPEYRLTNYSLARRYDGFDIRWYKRLLIEVICGVRSRRELREYRERYGVDLVEVEEGLGLGRNVLSHFETGGDKISLNTVLRLPDGYRAVPTGDPNQPYRVEMTPVYKKALEGR